MPEFARGGAVSSPDPTPISEIVSPLASGCDYVIPPLVSIYCPEVSEYPLFTFPAEIDGDGMRVKVSRHFLEIMGEVIPGYLKATEPDG